VAETPLVINDVQTIHKTVKVKANARPAARPLAPVAQVSSASGATAYAASNPPQPVTSNPAYAQHAAPTVSTHSSGGKSGGEDTYDSETNSQQQEGQDD
jgi:hypothetical protein